MKTLPQDPIQQMGITQFGIHLRRGEISSEAVTLQYLERIAALNPKLAAYVHVATEASVETARGIDRLVKGGTDLGPLMGVPVAVKDIFTVAGMPTRAGSKMDISDLVAAEGSFIRSVKTARLSADCATIIVISRWEGAAFVGCGKIGMGGCTVWCMAAWFRNTLIPLRKNRCFSFCPAVVPIP